MVRHGKLLWWCLGACLAALVAASARAQLIILNDGNFEHDTQAASGATTGDWLITFNPRHVKFLNRISSDLREEGVIAASVECKVSPKTCERFGLTGDHKLPTMFFRRGYFCAYLGRMRPKNVVDFVLSRADMKREELPMHGCAKVPKEGTRTKFQVQVPGLTSGRGEEL